MGVQKALKERKREEGEKEQSWHQTLRIILEHLIFSNSGEMLSMLTEQAHMLVVWKVNRRAGMHS